MVPICCVNKLTISWLLSSICCLNIFIESVVNGRVFRPKVQEVDVLCTLCITNEFAWSAKTETLLCKFSIIKVGIPYGCSLEAFCIFTFRSSSLGLFEGALVLGMLVVDGTLAVNGGVTVPIYGRVI